MTKPLKGLKVIELGQLIAGPFCRKFFSELRRGDQDRARRSDPLRKWRSCRGLPFGGTCRTATRSRDRQSCGPWKAGGVRRIARDPTSSSRTFARNTGEMGTGYERLRRKIPGSSCCGFPDSGQTGPYRDQAGFGAIGDRWADCVCDRLSRPAAGAPELSIGDALASLPGWSA